ncbi:uncharacterized protein LOC120341894 [Styela clava]
MKRSTNILLLCLLPWISAHDENHEGTSHIGVASDPVAYDSPYEIVTKPRNENVHREPGVSQEISSPGHVITAKETENFESSSPAETPVAYSNIDENSETAEDVSDSENSDAHTESDNNDTPDVSGLEAVLLSLYGVRMNQSLIGMYSGEPGEPAMPGFNCTELHCLYGSDLEVTTQSGDEIPENDDYTIMTTVRTSEASNTSEVPNVELLESDNPILEEHFINSDNSLLNNSRIVHDVGNDSPNSTIKSETTEEYGHNELDSSRFLVFKPPFFPQPNTIIHEDKFGNPEITILEKNITNTGVGIEFTLTSDQVSSERIMPSFNISANLDVPHIVPLLKRCGVFPACRLKVTAVDDVVNYDAFSYEKETSAKITNDPEALIKSLEVTCDPTSVSMIIAFVVILAVVVIISNSIIIVVTLRTRSLRKPHGYFKISLAIADLFTGTFVLTNISSNLVRFIHFNDEDITQLLQLRRLEPVYSEAAFFGICAVLSQVVTVYSVLLLSVDSFLSIRWPMQYRIGDLMTTKRAIGLIAVVWIFALSVSALPILAYEYVRYGLSYTTFSYFPILEPIGSHMSREEAFLARYIHVILYAVLVWGIPFFATWMLTLLTAYHSRGMLRQMSRSRNGSPTVSGKIGRLERDILRTVSIVLLMLTITVLPMLVCLIVISVTSYDNPLCMEQHIVNLLFSAYYILVCGSFINVIVYNACHKEFRRAMFDFLCDAISFLFSWICPAFCDLRVSKAERSFRSRRTRRTTMSSETKKKRKSEHKNIKSTENASTTLSNERTGYLQSGFPYDKNMDHSESVGSDVPSSSRTVSTDTCLSTSTLNGSVSSECSNSSQVITKIPAKRAASCNSVFLSTNYVIKRQDPR